MSRLPVVSAAVCGFGVGVVLSMAFAMTFDAPSDREEKLRKQVADARVALENAAGQLEHAKQSILGLAAERNGLTEALKITERQLAEATKKKGLGVSRAAVMNGFQGFEFTKRANVSYDVYEWQDGIIAIRIWGPADNIEAVSVTGSMGSETYVAQTALAVSVVLNAVVPDWPPVDRAKWLIKAVERSDGDIDVWKRVGDVRVSLVTLDVDGDQIHTLSAQSAD